MAEDEWRCYAGRVAFLGGAWKLPCFLPTEHQHVIVTPLVRLELCETHFREALDAGYITDPYISKEVAEHSAAKGRESMGPTERAEMLRIGAEIRRKLGLPPTET